MNFEFLRTMLPQEVVLYLVIFFGILLFFEGLRQVVSSHSDEIQHKNRRMRMIAQGVNPNMNAEALILNHSSAGNRVKGPVEKFKISLAQLGFPFGMGVVSTLILFFVVATLLVSSRWVPLPFAALTAIVLGFGLPYAIVDRMAEARLKKLIEQLPDALELMARGLRVGHPLNVTLRRVAREMPDPIGSEFGTIEDRIRHGVDLVTAFAEFADRVDREDAHYLSVCIGIQHGTGGNLGRVLDVLARVIRDRLTMKKKIHAISSEGRLSGMILTMMPFIIVGTIFSSTPSFFLDVKDHPTFMPVAIIVVAMIFLQGAVLKRLTDFDF